MRHSPVTFLPIPVSQRGVKPPDQERAARGQLAGTRQLGSGALAASSSTTSSTASSRLRDSFSTSVHDKSHKENQLGGLNARRPASATGDRVYGHESAMKQSVSVAW